MSDELNVKLPDLDPEIAMEEAECVANLFSDMAAGKIDTMSFNDLAPDQLYAVEVVGVRVRDSKTKSGEAGYPQVVFKLKGPNWTTSLYWYISSAKPKARQFLTQRLLTTFSRLLGPSYFEVDPPDVVNLDPSEVLSAMCLFYTKLGEILIGKKATLKVTKNQDSGYNEGSLLPSKS